VAIVLPSDIIMDVARAADPAEAAAAREALAANRANAAAHATEGSFSAAPAGLRNALARQTDSTPESYKRFEAMVLQTFIQNMLPKDTESVYGSGMAGDMWKSMMAEQLSKSMAERGGIGIASRLLRDHYVDGEKKVSIGPVTNQEAHAETDTSQRLLSTAIIEEMQRRLARTIGDGSAALDIGAGD
jgi:Rod binding domain-containing protein